MSGALALADEVEHFRRRVLQEALCEALAAQWERRAGTLRWAQPRAGEFQGRATTEELRDRWRRLEEQARACENRAQVAEYADDAELRQTIRAELDVAS